MFLYNYTKPFSIHGLSNNERNCTSKLQIICKYINKISIYSFVPTRARLYSTDAKVLVFHQYQHVRESCVKRECLLLQRAGSKKK